METQVNKVLVGTILVLFVEKICKKTQSGSLPKKNYAREKPVKCNLCDKMFNQNYHLT